MKRPSLSRSATAAAVALAVGCGLKLSRMEQADVYGARPKVIPQIQGPPGFRVVRVAQGFNFPSSMTWDDAGRLYVLESNTVPVPSLELRIMRLEGGRLSRLSLDGPNKPTGASGVGLLFHEGWLYFSHEQKDGSFAISRLRPQGGVVEAVVRGMPTQGDHDVNYLLFDREGTLYFGVGSATNSGVVASHDPVNGKWLKVHPQARDLPCRDLVLNGQVFEEKNALSPAGETTRTGGYQAYATATQTRVPAASPCNGALYKLPRGAREPQLVAWGLRNPVALALAPDGTVLVGVHGADVRGVRPILDDPDAIFRVREGAWYGWPDFGLDLVPISDARHQPQARFLAQGHQRIEPLIDLSRSGLSPPDRSLLVATTDPHAALGGMTVVPQGGPFARWAGQLLVSEMGDFRPTTDPGSPDVRAGFQVEAVDLATGRRTVFVRNAGTGPARPASQLDLEDGLERPVDVKVGPDGLVYVLDFGVFVPTAKAAEVLPKTGKVFRLEPLTAP